MRRTPARIGIGIIRRRRAVNHIDNEKYATLPFPPPALRARVEYTAGGIGRKIHARNGFINAVVVTPFLDDAGKEQRRPLACGAGIFGDAGAGDAGDFDAQRWTSMVTVGASCNLDRRHGAAAGFAGGMEVRTRSRLRWIHAARGEQEVQFKVFPAGLQEGSSDDPRAVDGQKYSEGYTLVTREDLGSFYYYQPARQRVSIVDVQAPHDLKVGYIMGAGDDIPTVLRQVGMDVTLIPAEKLASEDLSKYGTIVLGIRAYDTQKDVRRITRSCSISFLRAEHWWCSTTPAWEISIAESSRLILRT
jgi:hypothetical protein